MRDGMRPIKFVEFLSGFSFEKLLQFFFIILLSEDIRSGTFQLIFQNANSKILEGTYTSFLLLISKIR